MKTTFGTATLTTSFSLAPPRPGLRDAVLAFWGQGEMTWAHGDAHYFVHDDGSLSGEWYIDDGTPLDGHAWIRVPLNPDDFHESETKIRELSRAHPELLILMQLIPLFEPAGVSVSLGSRAFFPDASGPDLVDGVRTTHFAQHTSNPSQVWLDDVHALPVRMVVYRGGVWLTTDYSDWGSRRPHPKIPTTDVAVVPFKASS